MLLDWVGREGGILLSWWALVTLAGLAALPLLWRVLGSLPDRGYAFARAAGLLLVAFVFWLLASLGFLRNSTDSMALAWGIVLVTGLAVYLGGKRMNVRAYLRENRASIVATELLFAGLFILWAVVRAHQNGLTATEKPMELAFISSAMRSDFFPPGDPWLSGYAISYYYFGYVMAAMLALLSGAPSTMAFNLMIALLFALTGVTVFGVGYNLVRANALSRFRARSDAPGDPPKLLAQPGQRAAVLTGLLTTVLVVVIGNFQAPLIEVPYNTGAPTEYLQIFDSNERNEQRMAAPAADLGSWEYWWFFRGARVINDRNLDGSRVEVIDEFPQFSFLLADVHPHVLALPFAALAVGVALSILLQRRSPNATQLIFYAVVIGGLIFLNTWDGPIYLALLLGAEALRRLIAHGRGRLGWGDLGSLALMAVVIVGLAVLFYLPFLLSFRSQLGGVLPNFLYPTSFAQFFVMFGPLLLLIAGFLLAEAWRGGRRMNWRAGLWTALGVLGLFVAALAVFAVIGALSPDLGRAALGFVNDNGGWGAVLPALLQKRITHGLTALLLLAGLAVVVARLFPRRRSAALVDDGGPLITFSHSTGFALLLAAAGIVLTLTPEFLYLRDNFGTRMNTVFKFYYQAWLLWGVAAGYGVYNVLAEARAPQVRRSGRIAFTTVVVAAVALGLVYPVAGVVWRTQYETGRANGVDTPLTLDGINSVASPDDLAAIDCLSRLVQGGNVVVAERIGNSYDIDNPPSGLAGRIAGLPNVMNWPGHQGQWRGPTYAEAVGTRPQDIDTLYGQPDWTAVQDVIRRYGIDYIVFGSAELHKYGADADIRFRDRLALVCEFGNSRVYSTLTGN
jgi:YYY domain-containing protein